MSGICSDGSLRLRRGHVGGVIVRSSDGAAGAASPGALGDHSLALVAQIWGRTRRAIRIASASARARLDVRRAPGLSITQIDHSLALAARMKSLVVRMGASWSLSPSGRVRR